MNSLILEHNGLNFGGMLQSIIVNLKRITETCLLLSLGLSNKQDKITGAMQKN